MKKILVVLGAVAMVFASHAASVDWEIMNYDVITGVDGTGTWSGIATVTFVETGYSTSVTVTDGNFDWFGTVETGLDEPYTFTFTATDPSGATYSATGSGSSDNFGTGFGGIDAGTWTAPVPEPTSGLLFLLGVAGLALKRKRT